MSIRDHADRTAAPDSSLDAARRTRELATAAGGGTADLLVVGLGATGAGVALDAAARGLDVVAVDAHDLAFGTSRWSSKLIHGGCAIWRPGSSTWRTRARSSGAC